MIRQILTRTVLLSLRLGASAASAQNSPPPLAVDCWTPTDKAYVIPEYIRCIRDRDDAPALDEAVDSPGAGALDYAHRLFHEGKLDALDRFVKSNSETLKPGDLWSIRIFSYPSPWSWSWEEERPQRLVRALVCPNDAACPVFMRRD